MRNNLDNIALEFDMMMLDMEIEDAMEGLLRNKESIEKANGMKIAELLEYFVAKKGEQYFLNDKDELKALLASQNVGDYKIVKVGEVFFGIVDDGAYFVTKGRKGGKLTNADIQKLQKVASREMTKADRKGNMPWDKLGKKKEEEEAKESFLDFDDLDLDDYDLW